MVFNTQKTKEEACNIIGTYRKKLGNWKPTFNNIKHLYLKNGSNWEKTPIENAKELSKKEAWEGMPKEAIDYLMSLPEFDSEIFKEITEIDVKKEKKSIEISIKINGKEANLSDISEETLLKLRDC